MNWQGRSIYAGVVQGEALVTRMGISFFGGVDPDTGVVVEREHELEGQSIAGKVLVFSSGKGSTVGSYTLYRLAFNGKAPAAVINRECEPITAVGCIIAEIPCVDQLPIEQIHTGQFLQVNGDLAVVEQLPWPGDKVATLPAPLIGMDPCSFAHYTITQRFQNMLNQVIADYPWTEEALNRLFALRDQIPQAPLGLLDDSGAPDVQAWNRCLRPFQHQSWLEAPWFLVENYFFRRILAATGYFQPGPGQALDPYAMQKKQALGQVFSGLEAFLRLVARQDFPGNHPAEFLSDVLSLCLWGNQADLSMWSIGNQKRPQSPTANALKAHILDDHTLPASRYLLCLADRAARIDFILDNVGIELAYDLALADLLIRNRNAAQVVMYVKPHPTYVSDVLQQDVLDMVKNLRNAPSLALQSLAERLESYLSAQILVIKTHDFWTSPLSGWEMPPDLRQDLSQSSLIISKGDANYRRWVGDRSWPFTTPLPSVLNYFSAPLLAVRVLKSNVLLGLPADREQLMNRKDPYWLTNGSWGVIQGVGFSK